MEWHVDLYHFYVYIIESLIALRYSTLCTLHCITLQAFSAFPSFCLIPAESPHPFLPTWLYRCKKTPKNNQLQPFTVPKLQVGIGGNLYRVRCRKLLSK